MQFCPCGERKDYASCCGCFISGTKLPDTPLELMRSRYTAYTQVNIEYIIETMKAPAINKFNPKSAKKWATQVSWLGLEIRNTEINFTTGMVEFIAHFNENGKNSYIHEVSEFQQIQGKWYYIDGTFK